MYGPISKSHPLKIEGGFPRRKDTYSCPTQPNERINKSLQPEITHTLNKTLNQKKNLPALLQYEVQTNP